MIVYELRCGAGHGFEAWFSNSDAYDKQRAAQLVSCPLCGGLDVSKAPMAPRIGRGSRMRGAPEEMHAAAPRAEQSAPASSGGVPMRPDQVLPDQVRPEHLKPEHLKIVMSKIAELNRHIAQTCDYVGSDFAEEARKIHYGETPHRDIYGEATPTEAAELSEEGITVSAIPWIRQTDS